MSDRPIGETIVGALETAKHAVGKELVHSLMEYRGLNKIDGSYHGRGRAYEDGNYYDNHRRSNYGDCHRHSATGDHLDLDTKELYPKASGQRR